MNTSRPPQNKLRKGQPSHAPVIDADDSSHSGGWSPGLVRGGATTERRSESRTMALAREMSGSRADALNRLSATCPSRTICSWRNSSSAWESSGRANTPNRCYPSSAPRPTSSWSSPPNDESSWSNDCSTSATPVCAYGVTAPLVPKPRSGWLSDSDGVELVVRPERQTTTSNHSFFRHYFSHPMQAFSNTVTASEHPWVVRATRAEAFLAANMSHRQELSALSAELQERHRRDLAALNARYTEEHTRHQRMVWVVLGSLVSLGASLLYLLFHQASTSPPSRWLGPMHFTIPVLSPFASVIEHETSAVNVPLVAISLFATGLFAFLWFRCRFTRP